MIIIEVKVSSDPGFLQDIAPVPVSRSHTTSVLNSSDSDPFGLVVVFEGDGWRSIERESEGVRGGLSKTRDQDTVRGRSPLSLLGCQVLPLCVPIESPTTSLGPEATPIRHGSHPMSGSRRRRS